jgi:phenylpropionate dioxygenase-like ring-hydroxylating dioxygenase large terminal subunit
VCVHRGGSLAGGRISGDCIECPYHGWRFDGEGQCRRIPSLGRAARIPGRARVDAYPTEERFGLIHVYLGDLPPGQRPPIMDVPEYGQKGWRATSQEFSLSLDYRRSVENALDPAHNEFVHAGQGFGGERADYRVGELRLEETGWGCGFMTEYVVPAAPELRMLGAALTGDHAVIRAGSWHHGPSCHRSLIHPTPRHFIHQYMFKTPVDESHTRFFLVQMRNFFTEPERDEIFGQRNVAAEAEDTRVLAELWPPLTPTTAGRQLLVPADRAVARYRERLAEWQARGWRVDVEAIARTRRSRACAIPGPARRQEPKGWVLDSVPLHPGHSGADPVRAGL